MNFKSIENYLKKNYKFVIIICLFLFLVLGNNKEDFTTTQALDAVKSTEKKVNEMVSKVDGSHVRFPKKVVLDKGLAMGSLKMAPGNWLDYGIEVPANKKLGIHAPGAGTMELHVDHKIVTGHLQLGKTSINEDDLKKMKSQRMMGGFAIDGGGSTFMLAEGGWYNLYSGAKYDAWTNDRWDMAYIYRGWKLGLAKHGNGTGEIKWWENKTENVKKCDTPNNTGSSYKLIWVGY
jgi:hypothetical protein